VLAVCGRLWVPNGAGTARRSAARSGGGGDNGTAVDLMAKRGWRRRVSSTRLSTRLATYAYSVGLAVQGAVLEDLDPLGARWRRLYQRRRIYT